MYAMLSKLRPDREVSLHLCVHFSTIEHLPLGLQREF